LLAAQKSTSGSASPLGSLPNGRFGVELLIKNINATTTSTEPNRTTV
jgi:hypothetical protein